MNKKNLIKKYIKIIDKPTNKRVDFAWMIQIALMELESRIVSLAYITRIIAETENLADKIRFYWVLESLVSRAFDLARENWKSIIVNKARTFKIRIWGNERQKNARKLIINIHKKWNITQGIACQKDVRKIINKQKLNISKLTVM